MTPILIDENKENEISTVGSLLLADDTGKRIEESPFGRFFGKMKKQ